MSFTDDDNQHNKAIADLDVMESSMRKLDEELMSGWAMGGGRGGRVYARHVVEQRKVVSNKLADEQAKTTHTSWFAGLKRSVAAMFVSKPAAA